MRLSLTDLPKIGMTLTFLHKADKAWTSITFKPPFAKTISGDKKYKQQWTRLSTKAVGLRLTCDSCSNAASNCVSKYPIIGCTQSDANFSRPSMLEGGAL